MKRNIFIILAILSTIFTISGCKKDSSYHEHVCEVGYFMDGDEHYCICDKCGEEFDRDVHDLEIRQYEQRVTAINYLINTEYKCKKCVYKRIHVPTYSFFDSNQYPYGEIILGLNGHLYYDSDNKLLLERDIYYDYYSKNEFGVSTAFIDGDSFTLTCNVPDGYIFDGWYAYDKIESLSLSNENDNLLENLSGEKLVSKNNILKIDNLKVDNNKKYVFYNAVYKKDKGTSTGVGVDGGIVKSGDSLSLNIPKGALSTDVEITAKHYNEQDSLVKDSSEIITNFAGYAEFGPSGTVFEKPVTVTMDVVSNINSKMVVMCYDEAESMWYQTTTANVSNGKATFEVTHFSKYMLMDLTPSMFSYFKELVKAAKVNNLSDSAIYEEYKSFLIDECHVLDYYTKIDGVYFKPVGIVIDGSYHYNGVEGDPNQLIGSVGDVNNNELKTKIGATSLNNYFTDDASYKKYNEANADENQFITNIYVTIEYEAIEPHITVLANNYNLKKGESTTISIICNYQNPSNKLYPNFPLDNYKIYVSCNDKFSLSARSVITNSEGKASLTITAIEKGNTVVEATYTGSVTYPVYATQTTTIGCGEVSNSYHIVFEVINDISFRLDDKRNTKENFTCNLPVYTLKYKFIFEGDVVIDVEHPDGGGTAPVYGTFDITVDEDYFEVQYNNLTYSYTHKYYDDGEKIDSIRGGATFNTPTFELNSYKNVPVIGGLKDGKFALMTDYYNEFDSENDMSYDDDEEYDDEEHEAINLITINVSGRAFETSHNCDAQKNFSETFNQTFELSADIQTIFMFNTGVTNITYIDAFNREEARNYFFATGILDYPSLYFASTVTNGVYNCPVSLDETYGDNEIHTKTISLVTATITEN